MDKRASTKTPRPVVKVAFRGVLADFKLYETPEGRAYVMLPDGKRAYVTRRRDDTYILIS